ncbi:MAG TPA: sulfotransferase family protein [Phycisphaeraceae bacterium]|nr:sulfotransferase family protein [Phycisphaeraceae bacterium]
MNTETTDPEAAFSEASARFEAGELDEASELLKQILAQHPTHHPSLNLLGVIGLRTKQARVAAGLFVHALRANPRSAEYAMNLGIAHVAQKDYRAAVSSFSKAVEFRPDWLEAYLSLAEALRLIGDIESATRVIHRAVHVDPESAEAQQMLGRLKLMVHELDQAAIAYKAAHRLAPDRKDILAELATVLERQGKLDEAMSLIDKDISEGSAGVATELIYARIARQKGEIEQPIRILETRLQQKDLTTGQQRQINYALAKLYDKSGRYDDAFEAARKANAVGPEISSVTEGLVNYTNDIIKVFDEKGLRSLPRATSSSEKPIFIVGMPRSGTSLVEQILAAHPQVHGGGELPYITSMTRNMTQVLSLNDVYPKCVPELSISQLNQLAEQYLQELDELNPEARYVTDKMPGNIFQLGLLTLLFPEAHVIHCLRHPLDTCLSCYMEDFGRRNPFSRSLSSLAVYYRQYDRISRHWKDLPTLAVHEVKYEELVGDLRGETEKLLDFLDLPMDEACLEFHRTDRVADTLSYDQVRQPLYSRSVGRHRHYEKHLKPLKDELSDLLEGQ